MILSLSLILFVGLCIMKFTDTIEQWKIRPWFTRVGIIERLVHLIFLNISLPFLALTVQSWKYHRKVVSALALRPIDVVIIYLGAIVMAFCARDLEPSD